MSMSNQKLHAHISLNGPIFHIIVSLTIFQTIHQLFGTTAFPSDSRSLRTSDSIK